MKSKMFERVRQLHDLTESGDKDDLLDHKSEITVAIDEISNIIHDLHDQNIINYGDLVEYGNTFASLAAVYATSAIDNGMQKLILMVTFKEIMNNPSIDVFIAYAMKLAILLYRAEEQAQKLASAELNWVVAPEQMPEDRPNSDPTALPHALLPEASSQSDPSPSQDQPSVDPLP